MILGRKLNYSFVLNIIKTKLKTPLNLHYWEFKHFRLFIMTMRNHIMPYWMSVMMFLSTGGIEVYKSLINMNSEFMWKVSSKNQVPDNLRRRYIVYILPARSSSCGINSLAFRGSLLSNSLPSNTKQSHNLEEFKLKWRNLGSIHCLCVVCCWN